MLDCIAISVTAEKYSGNCPLSDEKSIAKSSFAVLLAAYNGALWIEEQVSSILDQNGVSVNLFISVDYSTDSTLEFIQDLILKDSRVHILPYGEKYGGAAKNFFRLLRDVDFIRYDYVALSDQDDIWLPNKLMYAETQIMSADVDAYSSDVLAFWEDGSKKLIKKSDPQKEFDYVFEAAGPGCTYVFRSAVLMNFKIFLSKNWISVNEIALHDWLIYSYFRVNGFAWLIDSFPLIHYRQHAFNQVGVNSGINAYVGRFFKVRGKWYRGEVEKIAKLLEYKPPSRFFMIKNFFRLRRNFLDSIVLLFFVMLGVY